MTDFSLDPAGAGEWAGIFKVPIRGAALVLGPLKQTWALKKKKKSLLSMLSQALLFPGNSPITSASPLFRNISSRPCSLALCVLESQGSIVYCFNICLTQSKHSLQWLLICHMYFCERNIKTNKMFGGTPRDVSFCKWQPFAKGRPPIWKWQKPLFCIEINNQMENTR